MSYWYGTLSVQQSSTTISIPLSEGGNVVRVDKPAQIKLQNMPETIIKKEECSIQDSDKWRIFQQTSPNINLDALLEYQNKLFGDDVAKKISAIKVLVNIADYGTLQWMEGLLFEPQTADAVKLALLQYLPWQDESKETLIDVFHANENNVKILNKVSSTLRNLILETNAKEDLDNHMLSLFLDNPSASDIVQVAVIDYFQQSPDQLNDLVRLIAIGTLSKNVVARLKVLQQQGKIKAAFQVNHLVRR